MLFTAAVSLKLHVEPLESKMHVDGNTAILDYLRAIQTHQILHERYAKANFKGIRMEGNHRFQRLKKSSGYF
jgi:hypothetical protein